MQSSDLQSGVVYLTYGTLEQISWLFKDQPVKFNLLTQPTTKQIRQALDYSGSVTELFSSHKEVVVIKPKELSGTGYIKAPKRRSKATKKETAVSYQLPTDQYFKPNPSIYCFVLCTDIIGQLTDNNKSAAKSLTGSYYEILDLRELDYDNPLLTKGEPFPMASLELGVSVSDTHKGDPDHWYETKLIEVLRERNGYKVWRDLPKTQFFRLFYNPNFNQIPILALTDTWGMSTWLEPFVNWIDQHYHLDEPQVMLGDFAYWVYCATYYWADSEHKGLFSYRPSTPFGYKKKVLDSRYGFKPSLKARQEWLKLTAELGCATLKNPTL